MRLGQTSETVEVTSVADELVPVNSGEKSATLNVKQLQDFSVVGRSAAEFIKIMPGFAITGTGTENRSNFTGETIGINGNGDGGKPGARSTVRTAPTACRPVRWTSLLTALTYRIRAAIAQPR